MTTTKRDQHVIVNHKNETLKSLKDGAAYFQHLAAVWKNRTSNTLEIGEVCVYGHLHFEKELLSKPEIEWPLSKSAFTKYRLIGANRRLYEEPLRSMLPASMSTVYLISTFDELELRAAIELNKIRPNIRRQDLEAWIDSFRAGTVTNDPNATVYEGQFVLATLTAQDIISNNVLSMIRSQCDEWEKEHRIILTWTVPEHVVANALNPIADVLNLMRWQTRKIAQDWINSRYSPATRPNTFTARAWKKRARAAAERLNVAPDADWQSCYNILYQLNQATSYDKLVEEAQQASLRRARDKKEAKKQFTKAPWAPINRKPKLSQSDAIADLVSTVNVDQTALTKAAANDNDKQPAVAATPSGIQVDPKASAKKWGVPGDKSRKRKDDKRTKKARRKAA